MIAIKIKDHETFSRIFLNKLGLLGIIDLNRQTNKYRFRFLDNTWMKLTNDECTAVLKAVKTPVALRNITHRLTS